VLDRIAAHGHGPYTSQLDSGLKGLRVGFVRHFHQEDTIAAPDVASALDEAAAVFVREGAAVSDVRLPRLAEFEEVTRVIMISEAAAVHEKWLQERANEYGQLTRRRMLSGFFFSAIDYVQAQRRRTELTGAVGEALRNFDVLLAANAMDAPCRIDDEATLDYTYVRQARMPFNISGHPAISLMCGLGEECGLPLSLQLVGRKFGEAELYRAAAGFEQATPWKDLRPDLESLVSGSPSPRPAR
jgi:aspartyl-tRNA(Asn)/glutamyl-tRNA(Gln) amidotransferase subunit A